MTPMSVRWISFMRRLLVSSGLRDRRVERLLVWRIAGPLLHPALLLEPFLEPGDLRAGGVAAQRPEIGAVALLGEPLEHLVELLAESDSREKQREPPELDRPAHHARKGRGDLRVGELVAGDLERLADELLGTRERQRGPGADVVGSDELKSF